MTTTPTMNAALAVHVPHLPHARPRIHVGLNGYLMIAVHLAAVAGVVWVGWSWKGFAIAVAAYFVRMVFVTAGYHRYFSHRAFKTSRVGQFLLALAAQSAAQKGVLWWAAHHRWHHNHADDADDAHSPGRHGFLHAHIGWLFTGDWDETRPRLVKDLNRFPELRFLNRAGINLLPTVALGALVLIVGGAQWFVWGFLLSTVLVWHGSFAINSLAHVFGTRRYATCDDSRNHWALALLTTGEGWHNNHHRYPASAHQGFHWWQIDVTQYVLRLVALTGLIWDVRKVPAAVRDEPRAPRV